MSDHQQQERERQQREQREREEREKQQREERERQQRERQQQGQQSGQQQGQQAGQAQTPQQAEEERQQKQREANEQAKKAMEEAGVAGRDINRNPGAISEIDAEPVEIGEPPGDGSYRGPLGPEPRMRPPIQPVSQEPPEGMAARQYGVARQPGAPGAPAPGVPASGAPTAPAAQPQGRSQQERKT